MKKVIRRARVMLAAGRSFMIAPEGTRVPPGETRRYQPGVVEVGSLHPFDDQMVVKIHPCGFPLIGY